MTLLVYRLFSSEYSESMSKTGDKPDVVVHAYIPRDSGSGGGRLVVSWGQPGLHSDLNISMNYVVKPISKQNN